MSREISIFADYHHKENSVTNYCGLFMKLLFQQSPRQFQELLTTLVKTDRNIIVGPLFTQQQKTPTSVPDLSITQQSFTIYFETKLTDWFYEDQIDRHIAGFKQHIETKILFLLSNFEQDNLEVYFGKEMKKAKSENVILKPLSFQDLVDALEAVCNTEYLTTLLDEFKQYLDFMGYLPKWKYLLDVVSCSETLNEINEGVYMCPDTGGSYSHRRAKYFGAYSNKKVSAIYEISAIVVIGKNMGESSVKYHNDLQQSTNDLIVRAREKLQNWDWRIIENQSADIQVFLLDNGEKTNFFKETPRGMQQSKQYFWDIATDCKTSKDLATKLNNKTWSEFK